MKKTKLRKVVSYLAITFTFALSLFTSCSNDEAFEQDNTKDTPITIASAGVVALTTRAILDGNLMGTEDTPATMGVFVSGGSETKYNATNVKWEHDGTSWTGESTMLYEGTGSNQQIYAYSPYDDNATADGIIVTATDRKDWLVATATRLTSSSVSLTMTHALAKLVLVPTYGNEVPEGTREIAEVKVGDMYASGTLNISDNKWALGDSPTTEELMMDNNQELLVIPMAQCQSFPITVVTADNRTFKATISLSEVGNKLEAGTLYNIKLQVGLDKVTLGGITASPWNTNEGGPLATE